MDSNAKKLHRASETVATSVIVDEQMVIKPASGLVLFALACVSASWVCPLWLLVASSLPLFLVLSGLLRSGRGFAINGWLFPLLSGALVSSLWATHFAFTRWDDRFLGTDIIVSGYIASLPVSDGVLARFEFVTESPGGKVRLSWRDPPPVQVSERWQLTVRLRRPHGFASPGAFDFEALAVRQGVVALGYVKAGQRLDGLAFWSVHRMRERLKQWLGQVASKDNQGLLAALLLGDKSGIAPDQWQVLNATGTTHLMVISGLHIGLLAWLGFSLAALLARTGVLPLRRLPLPVIRAVGGMLLATGYAALAGFGIPVQRALLMTFAALLAPLLGFRPGVMTLWLLALVVVLLLDPLAITSAGFWFSFVAVAALLLGMAGRCNQVGWLVRICKPQWLVFLLLAPLLLFHGQPVSPLSILVNLVAIPCIGLAVVPLLLLGAVMHFVWPQAAELIIAGVDCLLTGLFWGLRSLVDVMVLIPPWQFVTRPALVLAGLAMLLLIAPASLRLRALVPVLLLPLLFADSMATPQRQADIVVLDVGQGLSVLVKTHRHLLVYDTGDRFSPRMTAAQNVILPALSAIGGSNVERIMVSHGDRDHAGGIQPLLARFPEALVISGTPLPDYDGPRLNCRAGDHWHWDGVDFQVLSGSNYRRSNDASCVLKVTAGLESLLLPGDISARVERDLLGQSLDLRSTVLVAAHHGSRFSTSTDFLDAVQPELVVFSAGFANRFGHPVAQVLNRVAATGAEIFNTAVAGSVFFTLGKGDLGVSAYRKSHARYWW